MSTGRRFTADAERKEPRFTPDQLNELARVIEHDYSNMGNVYWALRQAAEIEAQVMGLVEAMERIEIAASQGATQIVRDIAREALSKFRGES